MSTTQKTAILGIVAAITAGCADIREFYSQQSAAPSEHRRCKLKQQRGEAITEYCQSAIHYHQRTSN